MKNQFYQLVVRYAPENRQWWESGGAPVWRTIADSHEHAVVSAAVLRCLELMPHWESGPFFVEPVDWEPLC
jgi:hypothetical protein